MTSPKDLLGTDGVARVEAAIAAAERTTSAEIVVVVARSSGRFERAEDGIAALFALLGLVGGWAWLQGARPAADAWEPLSRVPSLAWLVASLLVGALVGFGLARAIPRLPAVLSRPRVRQGQVWARAVEAFHLLRAGRTAAGTGVAIHLSLVEHTVMVVADGPVGDAVPPQEWESVRDAALAGLREGRAADGLEKAVARAGEILAARFPPAPANVDEVHNHVHLVD